MFLTSYLKLLLQQVQFLCKEAERVLRSNEGLPGGNRQLAIELVFDGAVCSLGVGVQYHSSSLSQVLLLHES